MILTLRKYLNFYNNNILHNGFLTAVASSALGAKQISWNNIYSYVIDKFK